MAIPPELLAQMQRQGYTPPVAVATPALAPVANTYSAPVVQPAPVAQPPQVAAQPSAQPISGDINQILAELRLDPDFAALPANWQQDTAQYVMQNGLAGAAAEMSRRASTPGQSAEYANVRAALARWANKAQQAATSIDTGTEMPLEQDLLNQALPRLLGDVEADAGRQTLADTLGQQAQDDYAAARNALSPEENARRLAEELAQADVTSARLSDSAGTAAAEQLAALQQSIASMQQNLTGDLAARASALQQQIASFTQNLNTFDATQREALAQQIAANQQNLETSIASQRQSLADEITALRGAADAQSVARKAALQAEIDGLTAAQVPMAEARLNSANALSTAINLGLEATTDQLTAQRAKQGYIGSSSFDDANLARATIGARQGAAQALGQARELNAGDIRTIQSRGATEGRTLADEYANNLLSISGREAAGGRTLADILAEGTRTIGDNSAAGTAAITANTGAQRMNIGNAGAAQTYQDQTMGSTQLRALLDSLAQGTGAIAGVKSQQQQQARDSGTTARQGYFDNAYTRGLSGTLARTGLGSQLTNTLTGIDDYAGSGLNRTQRALDWWATNPGAAPTPGYTPAQASNSGNDIAGLGAGLLSAGINYGNANSWWQKPAGAGASTSYADFLKNNPNSWAATGQT